MLAERLRLVLVIVLALGIQPRCSDNKGATQVDAALDSTGDAGRLDNERTIDVLVDLPPDQRLLASDTVSPYDLATDISPLVPGTWATLPPGVFAMGSPEGELCRDSIEVQHQVTLTHPFEIQTTEVTQGEFQAVMGYNPSHFSLCGADCPVELVSWHEAAAYCNKLSDNAGYDACYECSGGGPNVTCANSALFPSHLFYDCPGYRLPSESEWEYSARAGTTTPFHSGAISACDTDPNLDLIGWYVSNSGGTPHPVGQKQANDWLLHDMSGNVWEWCHGLRVTPYSTSPKTDPLDRIELYAALRGGSWISKADRARAAARYEFLKVLKAEHIGFRCARRLTP